MKTIAHITILLSMMIPLTASAGEQEHKKVSESKILNLFHHIQKLETKERVEEVLGDPLLSPLVQKDGSFQCWYIETPERKMLEHESPWGMGGIVVNYDKNGRVVTSRFNPQWVDKERVLEYQQKHQAEQDSRGNG